VADLQAIERELSVARKRDDNDARARLIPRALLVPEAQPHRAEYLEELAYAYQQLGRFDDAVEAMRQAVAAGWDGELDEHPSATALIADLLLRAGRTAQAEDAWLAAQREDPRNPWLYQAAGSAYMDAELHSQALPWQTPDSSWRSPSPSPTATATSTSSEHGTHDRCRADDCPSDPVRCLPVCNYLRVVHLHPPASPYVGIRPD